MIFKCLEIAGSSEHPKQLQKKLLHVSSLFFLCLIIFFSLLPLTFLSYSMFSCSYSFFLFPYFHSHSLISFILSLPYFLSFLYTLYSASILLICLFFFILIFLFYFLIRYFYLSVPHFYIIFHSYIYIGLFHQ